MRLYEIFLYEDKIETIANRFGNNLLSAYHADSRLSIITSEENDPIEIVKYLSKGDPTQNNKYLQWIVNRYISRDFKYEDIGQVNQIILNFIRHQNQLEIKDINQYKSLRELSDATFNLEAGLNKSKRQQKQDIKHAGSEIIAKGKDGTLILLKTREAACYYGKGTMWCTSATDSENYFDDYNDRGNLYLFAAKNGQKFQLFFNNNYEDFEFMNEQNFDVSVTDLKKYPTLKSFFKKQEDKILKSGYIHGYVNYAVNHLEQRWPEAENEIMKVEYLAFEYAEHFFPDGWPEAEPYIMKDAAAAKAYAIVILNRRWPEAEPYIMKNGQAALEYADTLINGRWLELEPSIMKDPYNAYFYAKNIIKGRWPEAEPYIMTIPRISVAYAKQVIRGRWPVAEKYIKEDDSSWLEYRNWVSRKYPGTYLD